MSANSLAGAVTGTVNVTPAAASQLIITTQPPGSVVISSGFGLTVSAEDPYGNVDTSFSDSVNVALSTNPVGATLGGTSTLTAQNGVATFSGLTLDKRGNGYTLLVTANGLTSSQTSAFNVLAATQLAITTQPPSYIVAGSGFGLVVTAEDQFGDVFPWYNGTVTVAISSDPGAATLGGTLTATAQNGVATFSGLTLDQPGTGYTLLVSAKGLPDANTAAFSVVLPTTWTVNSLGDTGTGLGTSGDLRYCITQADQTPGNNTINFSVTGTIMLNSALPDLSNTTGLMDVEGPGAANLTVSGNNEVRVFEVDSGVTAQLVGLRITGGLAENTITPGGLFEDTGGGGILNSRTLTVANSTIDHNNSAPANHNYGSYSAAIGSSYGGGIDNTGTLMVTNSTIDNNTANNDDNAGYSTGTGSYGGGIYSTGTLNLEGCTLSGNAAFVANGGWSSGPPFGAFASAFGGAVYSTGGLTLDDCTVSSNSAEGGAGYGYSDYVGPEGVGGNASGGGLYVGLGTVHVNRSSILDNSASGGNGSGAEIGASVGGDAFGGGLMITNQTQAWISQTLIAANSALAGYGGSGIIPFPGWMTHLALMAGQQAEVGSISMGPLSRSPIRRSCRTRRSEGRGAMDF